MSNMKRKIITLAFLASALSAPGRAATPDLYTPAIAKSVLHEFGGMRRDYFVPGRRVSDQIMMGLGIPDPTKRLADGNYLISGCRQHSCTEKSAVIVTPAGTMLAAGIIYFPCAMEKAAQDCFMTPYLRIFTKKKNDRPAFVQELQDWAAREGFKGAPETEILH
jgi:hypothetical protein